MLENDTIITALIPHRPPFVMVDRLTKIEEDEYWTEFTVEEDNFLVKDGFFQPTGMIENIAQSIAAGVGYLGKSRGETPKVGYIGAISRVIVSQLPHVGDKITTRAKITHRLEPVVMVHGVCYCDQKKLLEGEIKLVLNE